MSVWLCRCSNEDLERISLRDQNIYTMWEDIKLPVNTFDCADSVEHYAEHELDLDYDYACDLAEGMWAFASEMQIGDVIILQPINCDYFHLGIVAGGYCFDDSNREPFQHMRKVNFFLHAQKIAVFKDYPDILAAFETPNYITRFAAASRLMNMALSSLINTLEGEANNNVDNTTTNANTTHNINNNVADENKEKAVVESHKFDAHEQSDIILNELQNLLKTDKGQPFAQLMASVLKVKGFHEVTMGNVVGYTSLIAIAKADSVLSVRIVNDDKLTDAIEVEKFIRSVDSCGAKFGILISAKGYVEGLSKAMEVDGRLIKLWTCEDFMPELLKCYHKLCPQSKDIVPLKQVWVYDEACA